ncbi:MAG TPA: leucyl aminopeptidase [Gemmatimonadaceae bacterium]|nr:leucyl aminopeptidase [Gemmatimonadaceae bacterium]
MPLHLSARATPLTGADVPYLAIALRKGAALDGALSELNRATGGALERVVTSREFRGARDETLHLLGPADGPAHLLLVGLGPATDVATSLRRAAAIAARQARKLGVTRMGWYDGGGDAVAAERASLGVMMGAWEYADLKTPPPEDERRATLEEVVIYSSDVSVAERGVAVGNAIGQGMNLARRLAMMPGNLCTPEFLAATARDIASRHGLSLTVLGREELEAEQMGSFLSVAQGTPQDPKLIVLEYRRGISGEKPIALVGKGLCFDTGGISIKPAQGMEMMKFDMCGAAGVLGAMETIAQLGLEANVVGLVGATTNMPSGMAVKPGDVVRSQAGKYIEVVNTDAEGRLVLADVLSYARRFEPTAVVDAATLTGACVIALGHSATGVFGTDETLVQEVLDAGKRAGEPGWPLPLWEEYKELITSDVADLKNTGGRAAGAITAAMFLKEFAESFPWVHLDIAGTAYSETDLTFIPKGPTGVPVGLFVEFVRARAARGTRAS